MRIQLSKSKSQEKINSFFSQKSWKPEQMRNIKRTAMKYKISLKRYKKLFCKSCLAPLKGKTRISKTHKTIFCSSCNFKNRFKLSA